MFDLILFAELNKNANSFQAFSPTEPPKSGEALSRQNIPFRIGDVHSSLPSTSEELTQRYQVIPHELPSGYSLP